MTCWILLLATWPQYLRETRLVVFLHFYRRWEFTFASSISALMCHHVCTAVVTTSSWVKTWASRVHVDIGMCSALWCNPMLHLCKAVWSKAPRHVVLILQMKNQHQLQWEHIWSRSSQCSHVFGTRFCACQPESSPAHHGTFWNSHNLHPHSAGAMWGGL